MQVKAGQGWGLELVPAAQALAERRELSLHTAHTQLTLGEYRKGFFFFFIQELMKFNYLSELRFSYFA